MTENIRQLNYDRGEFHADDIAHLPEPKKSRKQLGQDLQPVGDCAEIEPYYRVCVDTSDVQHREQSEPEAFTSDN